MTSFNDLNKQVKRITDLLNTEEFIPRQHSRLAKLKRQFFR